MPGRVTHRELVVPEQEALAVTQRLIGRRRRLNLLAQPELRLAWQVVVECAVGGMQVDRDAGGVLHRLHAQDMIDMSVGEPDRGEGPAPSVEFRQKEPWFLAR